jgi:hypothetical protein
MSDTILSRYNYSASPALAEILPVLDLGLVELKDDARDFVDLVDVYRVPPQFFDLLQGTLGLRGGVGLTDHDRYAILIALGYAYHFKGGDHGLALIARALWRFVTFEEDYRPVMSLAKSSGVTTIAGWPAFLTAHGVDTTDLTRITLSIKLDVPDSRRYGANQAAAYRQLVDELRGGSGYNRLLRTYRPAFDASMSTLLGTSQFDAEGLLGTSFLLYGGAEAFLDGADQGILQSLRWNIYPQAKIERSLGILHEFLPYVTHLRYQIDGYQVEDTVVHGAAETLTVSSPSFSFTA